jgi:hypothetical protein
MGICVSGASPKLAVCSAFCSDLQRRVLRGVTGNVFQWLEASSSCPSKIVSNRKSPGLPQGQGLVPQLSRAGAPAAARIGPDQDLACQTASEINARLEVGVASALGFVPISIPDLRQQWLDHHEHVRRASIRTIERYRAATDHFLRFIAGTWPVRRVSDFRASHAEEFVRYLRSIKVAPNGHANAAKRRLRDNSAKYILETCSSSQYSNATPVAGNKTSFANVGNRKLRI